MGHMTGPTREWARDRNVSRGGEEYQLCGASQDIHNVVPLVTETFGVFGPGAMHGSHIL